MKYTTSGVNSVMHPADFDRRLRDAIGDELPFELRLLVWHYSRACDRLENLEASRRNREGALKSMASEMRNFEAQVTRSTLETLTSAGLDPRGFYVYTLWGDDDVPLYVGQSQNILGRLGSHMQDRDKRERTARVQIRKLRTYEEMMRVERDLIRQLDPILNISLKKEAESSHG